MSLFRVCSCCASGNLILLDKNSQPITPIIGWQTTVNKDDIDAFLAQEEQNDFYNIVGWPLGRGFPAAYLIALNESVTTERPAIPNAINL